MNKRKITLYLYAPHEMAELQEDGYSILMGNYWDFHSGCYGTKLSFKNGEEIDFKDVWKNHIKGPTLVGKMVAEHIGAELVVEKLDNAFC